LLEDVGALLTTVLAEEPAVLVGHSMGGMAGIDTGS
jgi:pimeloyl-ACP methyl ester carboxylesterase